jgi:hypothetical protein
MRIEKESKRFLEKTTTFSLNNNVSVYIISRGLAHCLISPLPERQA